MVLFFLIQAAIFIFLFLTCNHIMSLHHTTCGSPLLFLCSPHSCGGCRRHQRSVKAPLRAYWSAFSCLLCGSSATQWEATRLRGLYTPWTLTCASSHCLCVGAACVEWAATAVCPPSVYPSLWTHADKAHTPDARMPIQRFACFAYQNIRLCRDVMLQRIALRSFSITISTTEKLVLSVCMMFWMNTHIS